MSNEFVDEGGRVWYRQRGAHENLEILIVSPVSLACVHPSGWPGNRLSVGMSRANVTLTEEAGGKQYTYFSNSTNISSSSSINYYLMSHILPTVSLKPRGYHFVQQSVNQMVLYWADRVTASL